jgi:hypothetical protein
MRTPPGMRKAAPTAARRDHRNQRPPTLTPKGAPVKWCPTWGLSTAVFTFGGDVDAVKAKVACDTAIAVLKAIVRESQPRPKKKRPRARGTR